MIVDTSALIAVLRGEPDAASLRDKMLEASHVHISAGTLLEARIVAERDGGAGELRDLLALAGAEVLPVDARQIDVAFEGFLKYGKGRHPAGLNFGDCFAYGLACSRDEPLLFKGDDFPKTDVAQA